MTQRYTIETLASGQPRAYADSRLHVRVTLEHTHWSDKTGQIVPNYVSEQFMRSFLTNTLKCGFTDKARHEVPWPTTYLDWLRPIDPKKASEIIPSGDPKQDVAYIWEFHTTSPFTD